MTGAQKLPAALIIKPYYVVVNGYFGYSPIFAKSRGSALAEAWRCDAFNNLSFGAFLKVARARRATASKRFGELLTVSGKPAFYVSHNSQYIQFVRPHSDVVLNSHPMDVEPSEARRGTPYYQNTGL